MRKTIAAKTTQQRLVAIAIAGIVAVAVGCARTPYYGESLSDGGPAPGSVASPTVSGPSAAKGSGVDPWVNRNAVVGVERGYAPQESRLERRERTIQGRISTIDRQLDIIDMRRWQRRHMEPLRRYRPGPREVLLQRETRNLQFQQRYVSRELNRLEFEGRIDRSTPDPFADSRRFPSRSILEQ